MSRIFVSLLIFLIAGCASIHSLQCHRPSLATNFVYVDTTYPAVFVTGRILEPYAALNMSELIPEIDFPADVSLDRIIVTRNSGETEIVNWNAYYLGDIAQNITLRHGDIISFEKKELGQ